MRWTPAFVAAVGAALSVTRWLMQGSNNVYTDAAKRFYAPDPVSQWRLLDDGPLWLGLDALGIVAGLGTASVVALMLATRMPARRGVLVAMAWSFALLAWVPGVLAFASGGAPEGSRETRPETVVAVPEGLHGGLAGKSAGRYHSAPKSPDAVVAVVNAGGEEFDARFSVREAWLAGDPSDLRQPLRAEVAIAADSIDTGVDGRSRHAHQYLKVAEHPEIRLRLSALTAAGPAAEGEGVDFAADAELTFMGQALPVQVTGRLRPGGDPADFVVDASFVVPIAETPLKAHASDFGSDGIPIRVLLPFEPSP